MRAKRRLYLTLGALVAGTLVNAAILAYTPPTSFPVRPHDDDSLIHLVETEQRSLRLEHGFYVQLHDLAAGGTLISDEDVIDPTMVDGLADMTLVTRPGVELDPDAVASLTGARGVLESPDGGLEVEYLIVEPGEDVMQAVMVGDLLVAIGQSHLDELGSP